MLPLMLNPHLQYKTEVSGVYIVCSILRARPIRRSTFKVKMCNTKQQPSSSMSVVFTLCAFFSILLGFRPLFKPLNAKAQVFDLSEMFVLRSG
jgi:hypothetical protein